MQIRRNEHQINKTDEETILHSESNQERKYTPIKASRQATTYKHPVNATSPWAADIADVT